MKTFIHDGNKSLHHLRWVLHEKTKCLGHKRQRINKQGSALKNIKNSINRSRETKKQKRTLSLNFLSQESKNFHFSVFVVFVVCLLFALKNITLAHVFFVNMKICSLSCFLAKENLKRGRQICGAGYFIFNQTGSSEGKANVFFVKK